MPICIVPLHDCLPWPVWVYHITYLHWTFHEICYLFITMWHNGEKTRWLWSWCLLVMSHCIILRIHNLPLFSRCILVFMDSSYCITLRLLRNATAYAYCFTPYVHFNILLLPFAADKNLALTETALNFSNVNLAILLCYTLYLWHPRTIFRNPPPPGQTTFLTLPHWGPSATF